MELKETKERKKDQKKEKIATDQQKTIRKRKRNA